MSEQLFKARWCHREPDLSNDQKKILYEAISEISQELEEASDLISHYVKLPSEPGDGTVVMFEGRECDHVTHCG